MGSKSPPDDWNIEVGTWGTDIDRQESSTESGTAAIVMKNTTVASSLVSKRQILLGGAFHVVSATFHAKRNVAGDIITIEVDYYDEDGNFVETRVVSNTISSTSSGFVTRSAIISAALSNKKSAAIRIKKAATDFEVVWDRATMTTVQPRADIRSTSGSIAMGATNQLLTGFSSSGTTDISNTYIEGFPASDRLNISQAGLWLVSFKLEAQGFSNSGDYLDMQIRAGTGLGFTGVQLPKAISGDIFGPNDSIFVSDNAIVSVGVYNVNLRLEYTTPASASTPTIDYAQLEATLLTLP